MTYYYHALADSPYLPRDIGSDSAQRSIMTLLGELWPAGEAPWVPSAAIVELTSALGCSEVAARGALSRMQRKGALSMSREGRRTLYKLDDEVSKSIPVSELVTLGFGSGDHEWDGEWTVVVYSLPESQRERRPVVREWLRWLGFGPIRDGVWVSPRSDFELTKRVVANLLPEDGVLMRCTDLLGTVDYEEVWSLSEVRSSYNAFIDEFQKYVFALREGTISPIEGLQLWFNVLAKWRAFPAIDPDLPRGALPPDWPQREARRLFVTIYDESALLAELAVRSILEKYSPEAADSARVLSVERALTEYAALAGDIPYERNAAAWAKIIVADGPKAAAL